VTQLSAIPTETWLRTGPVTTPADLEAVFGLRYQVYCQERRYLDCADYPDALESDAYDGHAVHFAAFDQCGSVAAAARLVLPVAGRGFPFQQHASVFDSARLPPAECSAEVSRLVLNRGYRCPPGGGHMGSVVLGIYREMYRYSVENGITHWYAAMERPLHRLLSRHGFHFQAAGPEVDYFGPVTIYAAEVTALLAGARSSSRALHAWLRSGV